MEGQPLPHYTTPGMVGFVYLAVQELAIRHSKAGQTLLRHGALPPSPAGE